MTDPLYIPPVTARAVEISDEFINLLNQEEPWTPEQYAAVESGEIA